MDYKTLMDIAMFIVQIIFGLIMIRYNKTFSEKGVEFYNRVYHLGVSDIYIEFTRYVTIAIGILLMITGIIDIL